MNKLGILGVVVLLASCRKPRTDLDPDAAPAASAAQPASSAAASASPLPPPPDGRELPSTATFADLVEVASRLPREKATSAAGCVLRRLSDGSYRVEANLAEQKLSPAAPELDALLMATGPGMLLATEWGMAGSGDGLTLQSLSPLPRAVTSSLIPVLVVTDRGTYLRLIIPSGMRFGSKPEGPMSPDKVPQIEEIARRAEAAVVTAEAGVPLDRVRVALGWLRETKGPVAVAVPLAKGVPLPKRRADSKAPLGADLCPRGADLMDIPKGSKVGSYTSLSTIQTAHQAAVDGCRAMLPPSSGGGTLKVDMRIEPDGSVSKACVLRDEIGDAALRKCILDRTRAYRFPKPDTEGIVNFGTAVTFNPASLTARALCD